MKNYVVLMVLLSIGFAGVRFAFTKAIQQYFDLRMYLSLLVILAAGFVLHSAVLLMAIAGAALLVTASSRLDAICRLAILTIFAPSVAEFITILGLNLTALLMPAALSLAALMASHARTGVQRYAKFTPHDALVLLLILIFSIAYVRPDSVSGVERMIVTMGLDLGVCYYVYRRYLQDRTEFGYLIAVMAGSAMILAFFAICEARLHWPLYDAIYNNQSLVARMSRTLKIRAGLLRAPASFSDSTAFAMFEIVGVFAVLASRRFFRSAPLWRGAIALTIVGTIVAQSRGADLGLIAGLFIMLVVRGRYALAGAAAAGGATIVALLLLLASSNATVAAFIVADKNAGQDQDYRQTLFRRGLEVGMQHPLTGAAMPSVLDKMSDIKQGEGLVDLVNTYLTIFLCSGLVGLAAVVALLIVIFAKMFGSGGRIKDQSFTELQIFAAGGLGAVLVALAFTPVIYERNAYWLMLLLACCRGLGIQARNSHDAATGEPGPAKNFADFGLVHRWPNPHLELPG